MLVFFLPITLLTNRVHRDDKYKQPCSVYGNVYVTTYINEANYIVYEENSEFLSDLKVYFEENSLMADQTGLWHKVEQKMFADFTVYYTRNIDEADFSIFEVNNQLYAGCGED